MGIRNRAADARNSLSKMSHDAKSVATDPERATEILKAAVKGADLTKRNGEISTVRVIRRAANPMGTARRALVASAVEFNRQRGREESSDSEPDPPDALH